MSDTRTPLWRLVLAALLAAVAAGLIGVALAWLLEVVEWLGYGVAEGSLPDRVRGATPWRLVLSPAVGGLVAGALWWWQRSAGGVVGVEDVVTDETGQTATRMGIARPFGDAVLQVLTVGAGNSVGREGAPRLAAGAVAARLASALGVDPGWTRLLVASAAGAGLAAMYNAPLGGAAYAVEIVMLAGQRRRGLWLAVPVSGAATVVSWLRSYGQPSLLMPEARYGPATLLACLLVVPLAAAVGWVARGGWGWLRRHRLPDTWSLPVAIGGAGLATGTASLWIADLPGNGRDAFQLALTSPATAAALVVLLGIVALKPVLTGLTLGAGATGGLLAPSFSLGACTGAAAATGLTLAGVGGLSTPALALVGAGVTLGVTQRAPVFAAVFVWELTQGPLWTLPVLLVGCWITERACRRG